MNIKQKNIINLLIIVLTLSLAIYFFNKHSYLLSELKKIPLYLEFLIVFLYLLIGVVLSLLFISTVKLNRTHIKLIPSLVVNAKSLFINFFIPGQAGPVYRAYYLKTEHKVKLVDFSLALLIYYLFYALISANLLIFGSLKFAYSAPISLLFYVISYFAIKRYLLKKGIKRLHLKKQFIVNIFILTLIQIVILASIYLLELHFINPTTSIRQVLAYTGIANLALFVALTPGAIGIREAFLIFGNKITGISTAQVAVASVIDRSLYISFLVIIGFFILISKYLLSKSSSDIRS